MMDELPTMSRVEESRFWETHDATDYLDAMQPVSVTVGPRPRNRCPKESSRNKCNISTRDLKRAS